MKQLHYPHYEFQFRNVQILRSAKFGEGLNLRIFLWNLYDFAFPTFPSKNKNISVIEIDYVAEDCGDQRPNLILKMLRFHYEITMIFRINVENAIGSIPKCISLYIKNTVDQI